LKNKESKKYVIIGVSSFLSDIFDIIHANKGKVTKIFKNIPEINLDRTIPFKERVSLLGYDVKVYDSLDKFKHEDDCEYVIGCTTVKKDSLVEELKKNYEIKFCQLVHPQAYLGSNVHIGEGVIISPGVVVGPNAYLDDFCVIIRSASIGHDVKIGKYSRIGPAAVLAGSSKVGDKTLINMSASVLDHVYVGNNCIIGAGTLVNKDIPDDVIAYGIPAKVIRKNET
jgi:sugar O-acyltransferase (sialic acid O-acetyltransferase NeuD family)